MRAGALHGPDFARGLEYLGFPGRNVMAKKLMERRRLFEEGPGETAEGSSAALADAGDLERARRIVDHGVAKRKRQGLLEERFCAFKRQRPRFSARDFAVGANDQSRVGFHIPVFEWSA